MLRAVLQGVCFGLVVSLAFLTGAYLSPALNFRAYRPRPSPVFSAATVASTSCSNGCADFLRPQLVLCNVEGTPLLTETAKRVCFYEGPPRWVLTSSVGRQTTIVGGECFTAVKGQY